MHGPAREQRKRRRPPRRVRNAPRKRNATSRIGRPKRALRPRRSSVRSSSGRARLLRPRPPIRPANRRHRRRNRPRPTPPCRRSRPRRKRPPMADVAAKDVAALRKVTGAGMMDCKRALEETEGDFDKAKDWLREKGIAGAAKRAGREADQGAVDVLVEGSTGAVVELNCETDFVAKGDVFKSALADLTRLIVEQGDDNVGAQTYEGGTVDDFVKGLSGTLGEKIELGRVTRFESTD